MAGGVNGTLNAAALAYRDWSFADRGLEADLAARGMNELRNYRYRDDAREIYAALHRFVSEFLGLWYQLDADVVQDAELRGLPPRGGRARGRRHLRLPRSGRRRARGDPHRLVPEAVHSASPTSSSAPGRSTRPLNNGQFDYTYGEVANGPGRLYGGKLPDEIDPRGRSFFTEADFWRRPTRQATAIAQMSMVWVLSLPTRRSILQTGQFPSLDPMLEPGGGGGHRLAAPASSSRSRTTSRRKNAKASRCPYRYLDPENVSLSTRRVSGCSGGSTRRIDERR